MSFCLLKDIDKNIYFLMQMRLTEDFINDYDKPYNIIDITYKMKQIK